jgi:cold shock CspA family protein
VKHTGGAVRNAAPARRSQARRPAEPLDPSRSGRIVTLVIGQGHGFIRLADRRSVFFHRSDLGEGTRFGDLAIGETLIFDLLDDPISGPRALHVRRRPPRC